MRYRTCLLVLACAAATAAHAQDPNLPATSPQPAPVLRHEWQERRANESLAGEPKEKILRKLQEFRSGKARNHHEADRQRLHRRATGL